MCILARETAGAARTRSSLRLRPLFSEGGTLLAKLARKTRRDREAVFTSSRLRGEVGDEAQRSLRVKGPFRESGLGEAPPHPLAKMLATSPRKRGEVRKQALLFEN